MPLSVVKAVQYERDHRLYERRNLVHNGAMRVAQRGLGPTLIGGSGYFSAPDRWHLNKDAGHQIRVAQSTDAPPGFTNSYSIENVTAISPTPATAYLILEHYMEGFNVQSLRKGTAAARPFVVSFWAKSGIPGTYILSVYDSDNHRHISRQFAIEGVDTWEHFEIVFPADSTGTLNTGEGYSLRLRFWLAAGSNASSGTQAQVWRPYYAPNQAPEQVSFSAVAGATFRLSGVQMEPGDTATNFIYEDYSQELALCQRYYEQSFEGTTPPGTAGTAGRTLIYAGGTTRSTGGTYIPFVVAKRKIPTVTIWSSNLNLNRVSDYGSSQAGERVPSVWPCKNGYSMYANGTTGANVNLQFYWAASAEAS